MYIIWTLLSNCFYNY